MVKVGCRLKPSLSMLGQVTTYLMGGTVVLWRGRVILLCANVQMDCLNKKTMTEYFTM